MSYLFRDTDLAAHRLALLAEVFNPASAAFLREAVQTPPARALDLGCGPGYTTHMLAEATQAEQALGLDMSAHFVELATQLHATGRISFVRHDLTQLPFPDGSGDVLYARMLLTHLRDPLTMVERWASQLRPGGLLLLEEVEGIQTEQVWLSQYLGRVNEVLKHQQNELYIGQILHEQPSIPGYARRISQIVRFPVSTKQAATMFCLNLPSWRDHPYLQERYPPEEMEQLDLELHRLAEQATGENEIYWEMRQIVYEREK